MGLFKKKPAPEPVDLNCPAEGCDFVADDKSSLERHIDWKHPEMNNKE